MGTITDASLLSDGQIAEITDTVIQPTLRAVYAKDMRFAACCSLG